MSKLFRMSSQKHSIGDYFLAADQADATALAMASGRLDKPEDLAAMQDETEKRTYDHKGLTLKHLVDADRRGLAYKTHKGWVCIPLSKDCKGLHDAAIANEDCPRCKAPKGEPCVAHEGRPVYEGTAHRIRVRRLVEAHPEIIDKLLG